MKAILTTVTISTTLALCLHSALANSADAQPAAVQAAVAEFNALRHARAKQMFVTLANNEQHKNIANHYLGKIAIAGGHFAEARTYLETSVGVEPNTADELYWLGTACYALMAGDPANMELYLCYLQNLEGALSLDSAHMLTLLALHQFNVTASAVGGGSPEKAEELLAKIASLSKADADVARLFVLNHKQETEQAVAFAQAMIAAYPSHEKALLEAGKTLSNNKKYAEALSAFAKATAIAVTMDSRASIQAAHLEIGQMSWRTKADLDRGIAALTKAVDPNLFPISYNTNWAYLRLAQLHQLKGDTAQQRKYQQLLDSSHLAKGAAIRKEMENK